MNTRCTFGRLSGYAITGLALLLLGACQKQVDRQAGEDELLKRLPQQAQSLRGTRAFCELSPSTAAARIPGGRKPGTLKAVTIRQTVFNTDFTVAGVGGLRETGTGTIALTGVGGPVTKAILYWHGETNSSDNPGQNISFGGNPVTGTSLGITNSNCWGNLFTQGYRADVTALVTGNANYTVSGFGSMLANGASLIVFFDDDDATNNRDVVIYDGNDTNIGFGGIDGNPDAPADPVGWDFTLSGINYTSGNANLQLHVADGQSAPSGAFDDALLINGNVLEPAGAIFQGNTVPGPIVAVSGGNLWDIRTWDVTAFLTPGLNNLQLTTGVFSDCLGLIVGIFDLPAGAAPVDEITVNLDIKPRSCPNPVNTGAQGNLPMAILGAMDFDVSKIDVSTLRINGVAPTSSNIAHAAAPFGGTPSNCSTCSTAEADAYADLVLNFSNQAIVQSLGGVSNGQCVEVKITGKLKESFGGTDIVGKDYIRIISRK